MSDIGPGDVVVCVDARPRRGGGNSPIHLFQLRRLKEGRVYRVLQLDRDGDIIELTGLRYPVDLNWGAFHPSRFRKIDAPKTEISERIRACKPVRERLPA